MTTSLLFTPQVKRGALLLAVAALNDELTANRPLGHDSAAEIRLIGNLVMKIIHIAETAKAQWGGDVSFMAEVIAEQFDAMAGYDEYAARCMSAQLAYMLDVRGKL